VLTLGARKIPVDIIGLVSVTRRLLAGDSDMLLVS